MSLKPSQLAIILTTMKCPAAPIGVSTPFGSSGGNHEISCINRTR